MQPAAPRRAGSAFALVPFSLIVVLSACIPAAVAAPEPPPQTIRLQTPNAVSVVVSPESGFAPARVGFTVGGTPLSVTVDRADFLGQAKAVSVTCAPSPARSPRRAVTTAALADGATLVLTTELVGAEVRLRRDASSRDGELVLHVRGADRIVTGANGRYSAATIKPGAKSVQILGTSLVLQSRRDQHGLRIVFAGGNADIPGCRVAPAATGLAVHIPHAAGANALEVSIRGIRGDPTLALETLPAWPGVDGARRTYATIEPDSSDILAVIAADRQDKKSYPTPWEFFTGTDRPMPALLADPREAGVRLATLYDRDGNWLLDFAVGGDVVLAERSWAARKRLALGLRGLVTGRLDICETSFPVLNTDYSFGLALGYQAGGHVLELYLYHESSHLGDEVMEAGDRTRIDYSREAVRLLWSYLLPQWNAGRLRVYFGPTFNLRATPDAIAQKIILQAGAEFFFSLMNLPMYAALDLQSKEETNWGANLTTQLGFFLGSQANTRHRPRIYIEFYNGFSNMGQFFNEYDRYIVLAFGYNF